MEQQAATMSFPCGDVARPTPTVDSLTQSAAEWQALAELHFAVAQAATDNGDLETAITQTRYAETKLATARLRLIEARELEAMVRGS